MAGMFVLILAPYKTGTCYLEHLLRSNNISCVKLHSYDHGPRARYPLSSITHVITARRDLRALWLSALFQNLTDTQHYTYAYGSREKVRESSAADILKHFKSVDWRQYPWLNYDWYEPWFAEFAALDIPIITLNTETLYSECRQQLPAFLGCSLDFEQAREPSHCTRDKEFGSLYEEVKQLVEQEAIAPSAGE